MSNLKYFKLFENSEITPALLKNLWRRILLTVHPDKGGSHETYLEAQAEYETLLQRCKAGFSAVSDSPEAYTSFADFLANISPICQECFARVAQIPGIKAVEITGYWIWVQIRKDQLAEREAIKAIEIDGKKFQWHRVEMKWLWKGKNATARRKYTMEERRNLWGSARWEKAEDKADESKLIK